MEKMAKDMAAWEETIPDIGIQEPISDENLVLHAKDGSDGAQRELIDRYKVMVRYKASLYYLPGADREDLIQEGMIGLYKAMTEFDPSRNQYFRSFANLCVKRQILTAIKTSQRLKHMPLNGYISLQGSRTNSSGEPILLETLRARIEEGPEAKIIAEETLQMMESKIEERLSFLEWKVLMHYLEGMSYQEISAQMNRSVKSIDNALQRIKKKLENCL
jgi:RNA polymerase sporulation-specific sigma factor